MLIAPLYNPPNVPLAIPATLTYAEPCSEESNDEKLIGPLPVADTVCRPLIVGIEPDAVGIGNQRSRSKQRIKASPIVREG